MSKSQGLNYVAGLLLLATKDEEQSFWLLTVLIRNILPSYYSSDMQGLITDIAVMGELVRLKSPKIDRRMENLRLPWPIVVTKWFICLYAEVLPVEVSMLINSAELKSGPLRSLNNNMVSYGAILALTLRAFWSYGAMLFGLCVSITISDALFPLAK